jgi:hypothetical protein
MYKKFIHVCILEVYYFLCIYMSYAWYMYAYMCTTKMQLEGDADREDFTQQKHTPHPR